MNLSLICLSLKYINRKYKLISGVSKWIYFELEKYNYKESKFIRSLNINIFDTIRTLIKFNKNIDLLSRHLCKCCSFHDNLDMIKLLIDNGANVCIWNNRPLLFASLLNDLKLIKLLIDNGACINKDLLLTWTKKYYINRDAINFLQSHFSFI